MINAVKKKLSKDKTILRNNEYYTLPNLISNDLLMYGKIPLCLLVCIVITAILVVTTTHHTRLLLAQREQILLEHDSLDIEWRNLVLEEQVLGDHSRVEQIAITKLQMQHINPLQENILIRK